MIRTQIQLSEEHYRALKKEAARRGVSIAALVREGVEKVLRETETATSAEKRKRALDVVGKFRDLEGATDVSTNHDKYLAEIYSS